MLGYILYLIGWNEKSGLEAANHKQTQSTTHTFRLLPRKSIFISHTHRLYSVRDHLWKVLIVMLTII